MKTINHFFLYILISAFVLSGCSTILNPDQPENIEDLVGTHVAQTQDANFQLETMVSGTLTALPPLEEKHPQASPTASASEVLPPPTQTPTLVLTDTAVSSSAIPSDIPTSVITPTSVVPLVQVSVPTNCRTGPGVIFDQVSVLNVGKQVEIIGQDDFGYYWVVNNPEGSGTCWLWTKYATVTGDTVNLPVWASPPLPTSAPSPTPGAVTLRVSVPTNCRVGPGIPYDIVSVLHTRTTARVVGRSVNSKFWVIENPDGAGTCWVWGKHATLTGTSASLPIWNP